jgi:hypothetical protein
MKPQDKMVSLAGDSTMAPGGVEPPVPVARLTISAGIVQTSALSRIQTTRKGVTMSTHREAWLCVLQDADGNEETELVTIERNGECAPPLIELTNGVRVTCTLEVSASTNWRGAGGGEATGSRSARLPSGPGSDARRFMRGERRPARPFFET